LYRWVVVYGMVKELFWEEEMAKICPMLSTKKSSLTPMWFRPTVASSSPDQCPDKWWTRRRRLLLPTPRPRIPPLASPMLSSRWCPWAIPGMGPRAEWSAAGWAPSALTGRRDSLGGINHLYNAICLMVECKKPTSARSPGCAQPTGRLHWNRPTRHWRPRRWTG
jgi:hypothetical protein